VERVLTRPAVMQKVRETAQQPLTPLLRKKQHPLFPLRYSVCFFLRRFSVLSWPPTLLHTRSPCCTNQLALFSSARSPKES